MPSLGYLQCVNSVVCGLLVFPRSVKEHRRELGRDVSHVEELPETVVRRNQTLNEMAFKEMIMHGMLRACSFAVYVCHTPAHAHARGEAGRQKKWPEEY